MRLWQMETSASGSGKPCKLAKIGDRYQLCPVNPEYDMIPSDGWIIKGVCIGLCQEGGRRRDNDP